MNLFESNEKIFTVSDINSLVAGMMRMMPDFQDCWVAGEVSKVSIPTSGHCYFTLKDNNSEMKAVVWRGNLNAKIRGLLTQGNAIEAHGYVSVYERGGYYQLTIDAVRPKGRGNIYEELEKLGEGEPGESCESGESNVSGESDESSETEESEESGWNEPYIDDDLSVFGNQEGGGAGGGGAGGGDSGNASSDEAAEEDDGEDEILPAGFRGGRGGSSSGGGRGGVPSTMGELYGRGNQSGASYGNAGGFYGGSGSYFGNGASGDGSIATNYVDDISYELLHWKYGGFRASTNAVRSIVTVSGLRFSRDGMRLNWVRDLGAWGIPYEEPDALACLFVKTESGEWVGGKFDWISSSRDTRDFKNIYGGYEGWNLRGVPNPCEAAFVVFRKDGRRRSNIAVGLWQR